MPSTLKVNGTPRTLDVPADMPLLWALRDELDLKGTKFGCGIARCGACTVHVNGGATRSCNTPLSRVASAEITTALSKVGIKPTNHCKTASEINPPTANQRPP